GILVDARRGKRPETKISGRIAVASQCKQRLFFVPFPSAVKRTMKNKNDVEISWQQNEENYLNAAIGFYELSMLDEAEMEFSKIGYFIPDFLVINRTCACDCSGSLVSRFDVVTTNHKLGVSIDYEVGVVTGKNKLAFTLRRPYALNDSFDYFTIYIVFRLIDN